MKKIAILFPGQGSQYIGMCKDYIDKYQYVRYMFEQANDILHFNIKSMILDGRMEELTQSENAQPAVVLASQVFFKVYIDEIGIEPDIIAGHSLGEISALLAAEAISFEDGLRFSRKRGLIMNQAAAKKSGHAALILGLAEEVIKKEINDIAITTDYVAITGYNSPGQILVAGVVKAMMELKSRVIELGGDYIPFNMLPMKADVPFHCALMNFTMSEFENELNHIHFKPPKFRVLSSVDVQLYNGEKEIKTNLALQLMNPVMWRQIIDAIEQNGIEVVIDIGPQYILKSLTNETTEKMQTYAFDVSDDKNKLKKEIY
jgi:[acyl-carrier-protein] S-malonyltransferase